MSFTVWAYQFKALSFCLSSAPRLFTIVAREIASLTHSQTTALHQCLDDWLGRALFRLVNREKSELIPQQMFAFVSIRCDMITFTAHPTLENWIKNWIKVIQAV